MFLLFSAKTQVMCVWEVQMQNKLYVFKNFRSLGRAEFMAYAFDCIYLKN